MQEALHAVQVVVVPPMEKVPFWQVLHAPFDKIFPEGHERQFPLVLSQEAHEELHA